jgi:hypothetical protein
MRNNADVTDGKPIVVWLQSNSGGSTVNSLVLFNDIHGRKRKVLCCSVLDTTRDKYIDNNVPKSEIRNSKRELSFVWGNLMATKFHRTKVKFWLQYKIYMPPPFKIFRLHRACTPCIREKHDSPSLLKLSATALKVFNIINPLTLPSPPYKIWHSPGRFTVWWDSSL